MDSHILSTNNNSVFALNYVVGIYFRSPGLNDDVKLGPAKELENNMHFNPFLMNGFSHHYQLGVHFHF